MKTKNKNYSRFVLISLFLLLLVGFAPPVHAAAPTTGLVGYWNFDEGSGAVAGDSAGSNPGTFVNSPTWTAGKINQALNFNGSGQYVQLSTAPSVVSPYTTSFWFYPRALGAAQGLIAHGLASASNMIFLTGSRIEIDSSSGGTFRTWCNKSFSSADLNAWHHLAVVINSTANASLWKCYLDGVDIGVYDSDSSGTYTNPGTTNWTIGAYYNNSYWFDGNMDELRVYNRALSASEVLDVYQDTGGTPPPPPPPTPPPPPPPPADTTPPVISNIAAPNPNQTSVTVSWTTDEASDSQIDYGPTTSYGSSTTLNISLVTSHSEPITGLSAGNTYNYRVRSRDAAGNLSISSNNTFSTSAASPPPPPPSGGTVTAATCNQSDVQTAVNAATSGGAVNVPVGNCTWSTFVDVTKAISIIGAGSGTGGTKLTATNALTNGFFNVHNVASSQLMRISGFYFEMTNWIPPWAIKMYLGNALDNVRIDHNTFNQSGVAQIEIGGSKGVIDHNYFYNGNKAISFTAGSRAQADASWASMTAGTGDALFIEDNYFIDNASYTGPYGSEKIGTYNGGKLVIRYNNFDATSYPLVDSRDGTILTFTPFMAHGSACGGCSASSYGYWQTPNSDARRGQSLMEIYNNTIAGKRIDFPFAVRGSSNLIFNNTFTISTTWGTNIHLAEEEYGSNNGWVPARTAWPAEDQVHNTFIWNNTRNGSQLTSANISVAPDATKIQQDRDYFLHAPQASGGKETFVCASGVTQCNGAAGSFPTDGNTYPTKGTMVFSASGPNAYYPYTPYQYPHPLVSGSPPALPPPSPPPPPPAPSPSPPPPSPSPSPSPSAPSGGGGGGAAPPPPVVPPPTPVGEARPTTVGRHPSGTLINQDGTIYLLTSTEASGLQKKGFRNPPEYFSHGYRFAQTVIASPEDRALPEGPIQKALDGTLALDTTDNRTIYMIAQGLKRGFTSAEVFFALGYTFSQAIPIDLSDYPAGEVIDFITPPSIPPPQGEGSTEGFLPLEGGGKVGVVPAHPNGALVLDKTDNRTVWWIVNGQRSGFESSEVYFTYGFDFSKIVPANDADMNLPQGSLVKFRDGTLVNDQGAYFIISEGRKRRFSSLSRILELGYKEENLITANLQVYTEDSAVE